MTFSVADRVQETVTSPGTATLTLLGAVSGFQSFSTGIGANNTCYYVIADQIGINWEVGYGTVGATGTTLARTTVLASSTGGALVSFSNGTQNVWVDYPASKAVYKDASGNVSLTGLTVTSLTDTGLTSGRVTFASTGGLLADSANFVFDGTNVGIGTASPHNKLDVVGGKIQVSTAGDLGSVGGGAINLYTGAGSRIYFYDDANFATIGSLKVGASDVLTFSTNGTTEQMRLDSSGNLGLGVTPSAWASSWRAFEFGAGNGISSDQVSAIHVTSNAYWNGSSWIYKTTNNAANYYSQNGAHYWRTAPSGTAGSAITFTQAMTLDASGNLGIGTTSPAYPLDIGASTSANAIAFTGSAANGTAIRGTNTNSSSYYTLTAMGGSGYGVSGWANSLVLEAVPASTGNLVLGSYSNSIVFQTGGRAERMRIDASGNLLVGCTTDPTGSISGVKLVKPDTAPSRWTCTTTSSKDFIIWQNPNGTVGAIGTSGTTTYYNTSSDYRLKENIAPMVGCLDKVALLKPVTYKWKADGSNGQGFIAHELAEVVPDCVTGEKDATREEEYEINPAIPAVLDEEGNEVTPAVEAVMGTRTVPVYQGIDTSFLVATLTAAIQELNAKFEEYKASHP